MNRSSVPEPASRLARQLGTFDAVVIGMGAMIGAGIFAVIGPAVAVAGSAALLALLLAGGLAYCNAAASAQLAVVYPESGGTYVYGDRQLGRLWGFLAGWGFVVGKLASCAAMALTFASYAAPEFMRPLAVLAVLSLTVVNYFGVKKTMALTQVIVALVLSALAALLVGTVFGGQADPARLQIDDQWSVYGLLQAAGLWFFAFAGYARLATLGEEVRDPVRTIPRAIPVALGITLLLYALVAVAALAAVEPEVLAVAPAPLVAAVEAGQLAALGPAVRMGAVIASLGVLLSLIVGVSRTVFAMSAQGDLPRVFDRVHKRYKVPHRAELAVGLVVAALVMLTDLRSVIGFSAFTVLVYYAITNAAAWKLNGGPWARGRALLGLIGCITLAFSLPIGSVIMGAAVLVFGVSVFWLRRLLGV